ncbi:trypsin-like peptidase domain-containing protein [Litchfieldia alkalitelluris]|uniref:trypsin-like peptidase domain-containing protein n=1 Tax=Litchfieldia alkalitelluris TaxID=304268 RepID=UPI0009967477|nr:trypsin-like peptidase domain-containing protein [Litchfieldia alkalitelluris]
MKRTNGLGDRMNKWNEEETDYDKYEEPSLEDFKAEEDSIKDKHNPTMKFFVKVIVFLLVFSLLTGVFSVWFKMFNLPSFEFLQKSQRLSEEEIIQLSKEAIVTIEGNGIKGTGFNIAANGMIITNHHVVENMSNIVVSFPNGDFLQGEVIVSDPTIDFALVDIKTDFEYPFLELVNVNDQPWEIGEAVYIIGNPLAYHRIAIDGKIVNQDESGSLRLDALVHKGNSGSPVLNQEGKVIGVIYAKTIPAIGEGEATQGIATPINQFIHYINSTGS